MPSILTILDIIVLTETKLKKTSKPRTWIESLFENYKHWSAFDMTGGTTICVRNDIALATHCSAAHTDPQGRTASLVLKGSNTNLLLIGTYWLSGSSNEALTCRNQMQEEITTLMNTHNACTPIITRFVP